MQRIVHPGWIAGILAVSLLALACAVNPGSGKKA